MFSVLHPFPVIVAYNINIHAQSLKETESRSPFDTTTPYRVNSSQVPEMPEQKEILSGKERRRKRRGNKDYRTKKRSRFF